MPGAKAAQTSHGQGRLGVAELRLDLARPAAARAARRLARACGRGRRAPPRIATARAAFEGGRWRGGEALRRRCLARAQPVCGGVDLELAAAFCKGMARRARAAGKLVVVSKHNFAKTDSAAQIARWQSRAFANGAHIFKYAAVCKTRADYKTLLAFAKNSRRPRIVIGMDDGRGNPLAKRARLALPQGGSCIAFAANKSQSAPGQLSINKTAAALRR